MGESVVEGTVARWLKRPGDAVAKHAPLLEISTDKIDTEVPAPIDGVLLEILVAEGVTVAAGTVIAWIGAPDGVRAAAASTPAHAQLAPATAPGAASSSPGDDDTRPAGRPFVSPVAARMSAAHGVDLAQDPGTGLGGRIPKKDREA